MLIAGFLCSPQALSLHVVLSEGRMWGGWESKFRIWQMNLAWGTGELIVSRKPLLRGPGLVLVCTWTILTPRACTPSWSPSCGVTTVQLCTLTHISGISGLYSCHLLYWHPAVTLVTGAASGGSVSRLFPVVLDLWRASFCASVAVLC